FHPKPAAEWQHCCQGQGSLSTTHHIFNRLFSSRELRPITSCAFVIAATRAGDRQMPHAWNVDESVLVAMMVMSWIRGECLSAGFSDIIIAAVERIATANI
ncbi:hypothetical protein CONLIGDRAFT_584684, partial [Coniochaeta ligniaria NRRL 30616]